METTEITNGSTTNGAAITKRARKATDLTAEMGTTLVSDVQILREARARVQARRIELAREIAEIDRELGEDKPAVADTVSIPGARLSVSPVKPGRKPAKVKAAAAPKAPKEKPAKASTERLARRSAEEIQTDLDRVVALLQGKPEGLRAEIIKADLGIDRRALPAILKAGVKSNALSFSGKARATVYFAR